MGEVDLKKASTYYLVGNLFNKGISFLTVPVFTRLLDISDYGIVTTFNSWVAILSMIFGFAIYMGIRAAFIDFEDRIDDVVSVTSTFTVLSGIIISFFIISACVLININLSVTLIILCCLQGISAALVQNYSIYLMMKYRYRARTALMILPNLLSALISIGVVAWIVKDRLYLGRIVPTTAVYIAFALCILFVIFKRSKMLFNREYLFYALKISVPLVLHGVALNILSQSDLTMITWLADSSQAGLYSLIYNFSMIATVITTSLDGVWIPWFTGNLKLRQIEEINEHATDYINLMSIALIEVILVSPEAVKILASREYWNGISIIPPIVMANYLVFAYTLYVNIEHFYKRTVYITINTLIAASSNIILNCIFIPKYGYAAAAYTTVASYFLAFVLHTNYAKRLEHDLYPIIKFMPSIIQIVIASLLFYVFIDRWLIRWELAIIFLITAVLGNKKRIQAYLPTRIQLLMKKERNRDENEHI